MNPVSFDRVAKAFANRRINRRTALTIGASAGAAIGLSPAGMGALAQDQATPAATPSAALPDSKQQFLFVQTASNGSWKSDPDQDGVYVLTLTGVTDQTIYFSDRPERIVGVVALADFLETLGFTPENPPNAALVTGNGENEQVLVIELFNPTYDVDSATLTYEARMLADYDDEGLAFLASQQVTLDLPESLEDTSLFIDDCPNQDFWCFKTCVYAPHIMQNVGSCWHWIPPGCLPCNPQLCNETYPDECDGGCEMLTAGEVEHECFPN